MADLEQRLRRIEQRAERQDLVVRHFGLRVRRPGYEPADLPATR